MHQTTLDNEDGFDTPKLWTIRELQRAHIPEFKEKIIEEEQFLVFFSNQGIDPKEDPIWNKRRTKGRRNRKPCAAINDEGHICGVITQSPFGVCKTHMRDFLRYHPVDWVGYFIPPQVLLESLDDSTQKRILSHDRLLVPMHGWLIERLLSWSKLDKKRTDRVSQFMAQIEESIPGKISDATSLQEALQTHVLGSLTPQAIVSSAMESLDAVFPIEEYAGEFVPNCNFSSRPRKVDLDFIEPVFIEIPRFPVRAIAGLTFLAMVAEEANRGDAWFRQNYNLGEPERAGAHFAYTIYILRREGRMSITQISKLLQVPPWE
ncbi:MAG: hypothetical protein ACFFER_18850 [Candidatus Thorarchaeota archaeon]